MHTPLDPHLHTAECNRIIALLQKCHAETSKVSQLFGACNELDLQMRLCTKNERLIKIDENRKSSKERQQKHKEKLRKYEEEGKTWRDILDERNQQK